MIRAGVYGATGYTGFELIEILMRHPRVSLAFATSRSYAGKQLSEAFPCPYDLRLVDAGQADLSGVDVVFCALPHGATVPTAAQALEQGVRVIDLSADFRLRHADEYRRWYGKDHEAPALLDEAVYGLPELYRDRIPSARLVANPGCYPTSVILGLLPLVRAGLLAEAQIIADSKSGVSGAGRSLSLKTHFVEAHENFSPYNIGHSHRHIAEMEQELGALAGSPIHVIFSPHLLPVNRGILSTIYVRLRETATIAAVRDLYQAAYADEPFVHLLPQGQLPSLRHVVGTNRCVVQVQQADERGTWIVTSAIDNLQKGASGQAVQNMNLLFGLPETLGLVL
ncbi:MAG: N-acetyl-gamma-glutamyl-phosphate reductase [Herpetosiphonaceae bacterium]|nr:MAG: N-acetyl-gamma-glutamyl-phosphate reductase [Herpetosiphonaceae bacterium]